MYYALKLTVHSVLGTMFVPLAASAHEAETSVPFERPHAHEKVETHVHLGWDSRYFLEGRDALDGDSIIATSVEFGWKHFSGGIWYGYSPDQRYDELQIGLALTHCIGDDFEFYIGYTHLRAPFENTHDDEVGVGFTWSGLPCDLEFSTDIYYSFDAGGYFGEVAATREFEVCENLTLSLSGIFGVNQGYVTDGHDGANHVAVRLEMEYELCEGVAITAHTAYSWALNHDSGAPGDDQLIDFFHGGVGLQWSF